MQLVERAAAYQSTLEPEAGTDYFLNRLKDFHSFGRDLRPNPITGKYAIRYKVCIPLII